jgi:hypothetical protein
MRRQGMKPPLTMRHVELCACGTGIVHDGELECSACSEDAFRRGRRIAADVDLRAVKAVPPVKYLSGKLK